MSVTIQIDKSNLNLNLPWLALVTSFFCLFDLFDLNDFFCFIDGTRITCTESFFSVNGTDFERVHKKNVKVQGLMLETLTYQKEMLSSKHYSNDDNVFLTLRMYSQIEYVMPSICNKECKMVYYPYVMYSGRRMWQQFLL